MARKTIDIDDVKDPVNTFLLHSSDELTAERRIMATMLGNILHGTGQYNGFNYLTPDMMKKSMNGTTIGVDHDKPEDKRFDGTDDTRVFYY